MRRSVARGLLPAFAALSMLVSFAASCKRTDADIARDFYGTLCEKTYYCGELLAWLHGDRNLAYDLYGPEEKDCVDYFCGEACFDRFESGDIALANPGLAEACLEPIRHFPCSSEMRNDRFGDPEYLTDAGRIPGGCDHAMDLAP